MVKERTAVDCRCGRPVKKGSVPSLETTIPMLTGQCNFVEGFSKGRNLQI